MKTILLVLAAFFAVQPVFAQETLNEEIKGAMRADPEVRAARQRKLQEMQHNLPGCAPVSVGDRMEQHLLSATNQKQNGQFTLRRKTYLVTSYVACSKNDNGVVIGVRRGITAKVQMTVVSDQLGNAIAERPTRVILVDINDLE